jgi:mannosyl-oligosaccharide glucosidase
MAGYGWDEYDVRTGGQQTIHDAGNKIDITTSFVKIPGGTNGGSWAVRVKGTPRKDAPAKLVTTMVFYATLEGIGSLEVEDAPQPLGYAEDVTLKGDSAGLGEYTLKVTKGKGNPPPIGHPSHKDKPLDRMIVSSQTIEEPGLWQVKPILYNTLKVEIDEYIEKYTIEAMPPPWQVYTVGNNAGKGNMHFIQQVFEGPFEFDILFSSGSAPEEITSEVLTGAISAGSQLFAERFQQIFNLKAPYNTDKYGRFAKSMFSNLFGGIGYFHGDEIVDRSYAPEYEEENEGFWEEAAEARARKQEKHEGPYELFTSIPSRPFFPRGFLWDEGFHLLPIADWDMDVAMKVVKSWFNLMDKDGWIAREQILGEEARSKVPPEFQVQYPHYANPPTLLFILEAFVERLTTGNGDADPNIAPELGNPIKNSHVINPETAKETLEQIYPLLKRQFEWFRRTQSGDLATYDREAFSPKEAYRWRGRTVDHLLTSGLDDYPRPQPPHPGELHVDLISWMGVMTKSLSRIASYLGEEEDAKLFARTEEAILRNIDDLHWSKEKQTFCDATVDAFEENQLVCHKGYVSIFPFITGLLPPGSPRLGAILDTIGDPEELWTDFGLRSLSKSDEFYGTAENYWRGPIWMNMNYLAVRELLVSRAAVALNSVLVLT